MELSLAHRVNLDRRASVLGDQNAASSKHLRASLVMTSSISLFNLLLLSLGVLLTAITEGKAAESKVYARFFPRIYMPQQAAADSTNRHTVFFYCSIPFVNSSLSIYETFILWRRDSMAGHIQTLASAGAGLFLWIVQLSIEARCVWSSSSSVVESASHCPIMLSGWPLNSWSRTTVLAWTLPWLATAVILL